MARVSIIIPFLNPGGFLRPALESVLGQRYEDWEVRLIDDGSSDDSPAIAREFATRYPDRIFEHRHPGNQNRGTASSRNLGASRAGAELLAFLDADDVWFPDTLLQQVRLLDRFQGADVVYGTTQYWHSWSGEPGAAADETPELGTEPEVVYAPPQLAILNYPLGVGPAPSMNTVMIRRAAFERVGGFEESFTGIHRMYEDQAFLTKLYLDCSIVTSPECWDRYRQHAGSICARVTEQGRYEEARRHYLSWCREYLDRRGINDAAVREAWVAASQADDRPTDPPSWRQQPLTEARALQLVDHSFPVRNVVFGDRFHLLGMRATRLVGGRMKVELVWKSLASQLLSRTVAVHLVDAEGSIRGQADYPQNRGLGSVDPGSIWRDVVVVPESQLDGATAVAIGLFDPGGDLLPAVGGWSDWSGRRVWMTI